MLSRLRSYWHFRKNRFERALAVERPGRESDRHLWAYYRLGMYETVAGMAYGGGNWRGLFAKAVSYAACNRYEEAEAVVRLMTSRADCRPKLTDLGDALAPFVPELALEIIDVADTPAALRAALLMRVGRTTEASGVLESAFERGEHRRSSELLLYRSNAMPGTPAQQLENLNGFLASHGLSALELKDPAQPPSPINVSSSEPAGSAAGPLVTILMTTYNTGKRADVAIESLLNQSYKNIELIVVDDASKDDTPEIVQAWTERDSRVKLIRLECNSGTYVAKNIGLRDAAGEYVTCHDSDDWSHPFKIERQVRPLIENPRLVATTSHWVRMQDDGVYYARPVHPLMRLNPSSPLFRKEEVLRHAGIWDCVRTGADSEFLARLKVVFGKKAVKRVVQPLALGSHRPDSLMTASSTGYSETGVSPQRLAYWEAWGAWHLRELRAGRTPFVPADLLAERRFSAPEPIRVPTENIERNLHTNKESK